MNNPSASTTETLMLKYKDGIRTIIVSPYTSLNYLKNHITECLNSIDIHRVTWEIDYIVLDLDCAQFMLSEKDNVVTTDCLEIPYNFSMGEEDEEQRIKQYYPNWEQDPATKEDEW